MLLCHLNIGYNFTQIVLTPKNIIMIKLYKCYFTMLYLLFLQVQETARSIIQSVEGDLDSEQTLPMTSSPPGGRTSVDKAADKWTLAFCEFYRDS